MVDQTILKLFDYVIVLSLYSLTNICALKFSLAHNNKNLFENLKYF